MTRREQIEEASIEFRKPNWPHKSEWNKPERYDTLMYYEIGDYVESAFEAGAEWADANPTYKNKMLMPLLSQNVIELQTQLSQTQAALAVAVEALKNVEFCPISISSSIISDMQETATKALAKIAELQKEKVK